MASHRCAAASLLLASLLSGVRSTPPQAACFLPRARGVCHDFTRAWHFDSEQGDCASFWFGGCGGNANNFASAAACRAVCVEPGAGSCLQPAVRGPCTDAAMLWAFDAAAGGCTPFVYGGCYGTSNRFATRGACEARCLSSPTRCRQPERERGPCQHDQARYSYVQASARCERFVYGGCGGSANNFATLERCQKQCGGASAKSGDTPVEKEGQGELGETTQAPLGVEEGTEVQDSVPTTAQTAAAADICALRRDPGRCFAYAPMFYFDPVTGSCHLFSYRGCGGNSNRFHTRQECEIRCLQPRGGADAEADAADATLNTTVVEISLSSEELNETIAEVNSTGTSSYHSIALNINDSRQNELLPATNAVETTTSTYSQQPKTTPLVVKKRHRGGGRGRRRACRLPHRQGRCRLYLPRFYYNAALGACYTFIFGGCGGNGNRFRTRAACEQICKGVKARP